LFAASPTVVAQGDVDPVDTDADAVAKPPPWVAERERLRVVTPETQHRIILAAPRPDLSARDAWTHWTQHHGDAVRGLPNVVGYIQDRVLELWWERTGLIVCTESWFTSRDGEAEAFASDHYRDVVGVDEARFMDRERAWTSVVRNTEVLRDGPRSRFRVLAFGTSATTPDDIPKSGRIELLHLRRSPPGREPRVALSAWTDDEEAATALAEHVDGLAFVATPKAIVAPPDWTG
jgi:EthD domain